jgi:outer membrane protein assembly factor BamD (BamD/ComL family)
MPLIQAICAVFALCLFFAIVGCGESPQQMFETAQFEELQNNQKHARELYERIIRKHPDSDFAKKAALRLAELQRKPGH